MTIASLSLQVAIELVHIHQRSSSGDSGFVLVLPLNAVFLTYCDIVYDMRL